MFRDTPSTILTSSVKEDDSECCSTDMTGEIAFAAEEEGALEGRLTGVVESLIDGIEGAIVIDLVETVCGEVRPPVLFFLVKLCSCCLVTTPRESMLPLLA